MTLEHVVRFAEEDRQMVLMALADESVKFPGFGHYLGTIADKLPGGRQLFEAFRRLRDASAVLVDADARSTPLVDALAPEDKVRAELALARDRLAGLEREVATARRKLALRDAEVASAWAALGTTVEDAADDPDTSALADSIKVSLKHERDRAEQAVEQERALRVSAELRENAASAAEEQARAVVLKAGRDPKWAAVYAWLDDHKDQAVKKIADRNGELERALGGAARWVRRQLQEMREKNPDRTLHLDDAIARVGFVFAQPKPYDDLAARSGEADADGEKVY